MSSWLAVVRSQFDGLMPGVIHLNIPWSGTTVVALLFDTDRAPFVVVNAHFGSRADDPISFEVPWREGNETRSAGRSELVRILSPVATLPQLEVIWATADGFLFTPELADERQPSIKLSVRAHIYVVPAAEGSVVIPNHKAAMFVWWQGIPDPYTCESVSLYPVRSRGNSLISSLTSELLIQGPGSFQVSGNFNFDPCPAPPGPVNIEVLIEPVMASSSIVLEAALDRVIPFDHVPGPGSAMGEMGAG